MLESVCLFVGVLFCAFVLFGSLAVRYLLVSLSVGLYVSLCVCLLCVSFVWVFGRSCACLLACVFVVRPK